MKPQGTGCNEWYTPSEYVDAARAVMGSIDLDPASNGKAQQIVSADRYFTEADDGLSKEWAGRVWLNPPYGRKLIGRFVDKLLRAYRSSAVSQAVMLTHASTDTGWWHAAASDSVGLCFTRGRIRFYGPNGEIAQPSRGSCFFYYGTQPSAFALEFGRFGFVLMAHGNRRGRP